MTIQDRLAKLQKHLEELQIQLSNCTLETEKLKLLKSIRYYQNMVGKQPVLSKLEIPPLCKCGCGNQVTSHRGFWNLYVRNHQPTGEMSQEAREKISNMMKEQNPMKNQASLEKSVQTRLNHGPYLKSEQGLQNISIAAKKRMNSDQNPMKNPEIYQKTIEKILSHQKPKTEIHFENWLLENYIENIEVTSNAKIWISKKNPDYRIKFQKKAIELTMKEVFIGEKINRSIERYAIPVIMHYIKHGWNCLVIYTKGHTSTIPSELKNILIDYQCEESNWSGIWYYDRLLKLEELKKQ